MTAKKRALGSELHSNATHCLGSCSSGKAVIQYTRWSQQTSSFPSDQRSFFKWSRDEIGAKRMRNLVARQSEGHLNKGQQRANPGPANMCTSFLLSFCTYNAMAGVQCVWHTSQHVARLS